MQNTGLKRSGGDKYYTKPAVVEMCLLHISEVIGIANDHFIIEPSAGNGAFIPGIKKLCGNTAFYDIKPDVIEPDDIKLVDAEPDIIQQDYLTLDVSSMAKYKTHVIGNPPFGRQSSLAIKFIKKSAEFCDTISFILPKSFKKDSLKKHFPLEFHLVFEKDMPRNSFMVGEKEHDVPCVFQIWEKRTDKRELLEKLYPSQYIFVKKTEEPHISFRRVGVNAGVIDTEYMSKSEQSHYFIRFKEGTILTKKLYNEICDIKFTNSEYTVGPKSISKQELIKEFNKIL